MASLRTYEYLTGVLSVEIDKLFAASTPKKLSEKYSYHGFGVNHKVVSHKAMAIMAQEFDEVLCCNKSTRCLLAGDDGSLWAFNGEYYESVSNGEGFITELIKRTMIKLSMSSLYIFEAPKYIAKEITRAIYNTDECRFRPNRRYIVFKNGVFDIDKNRLNKFSAEYVTDLILDYDYNSKASCLLWDIKIKEIIPNDDMRNAFQMFCGSLLVRREELKIEYLCLLIGSGANGKSVLSSVIMGAFGEKYFGRCSPKQLFRSSDSSFMASLAGKIGNFTDDIDSKDFSGGDLKSFISGEKMQARRMYRDPMLVQAPPMLVCTNTVPETGDDTWGYHRRQLPIYTTTKQWTEKDKDPMLAHKLQTTEARQRIFNWIHEGYKKIMQNNGTIKLGEDTLRAQEALMDNSTSVRRWWRDSRYCKPNELIKCEWVLLSKLLEDYKTYCNDMLEVAKSGKEVSAILASAGLEKRRRSDGYAYLVGLRGTSIETLED